LTMRSITDRSDRLEFAGKPSPELQMPDHQRHGRSIRLRGKLDDMVDTRMIYEQLGNRGVASNRFARPDIAGAICSKRGCCWTTSPTAAQLDQQDLDDFLEGKLAKARGKLLPMKSKFPLSATLNAEPAEYSQVSAGPHAEA